MRVQVLLLVGFPVRFRGQKSVLSEEAQLLNKQFTTSFVHSCKAYDMTFNISSFLRHTVCIRDIFF